MFYIPKTQKYSTAAPSYLLKKLHVTKQSDVFVWQQKNVNYILPSKAHPFLHPFLERIVSKIIHYIQDKRNFLEQGTLIQCKRVLRVKALKKI